MAWTRDVVIGPYGASIRTKVTLLWQSLSGNTSRVRVEVSIYKGAGSSNAYDSSVSTSISGDVVASKTMGINVPSNSWRELWDVEYTIPHGSNGSKSFSVTGTLGPTGTSTFGNGGSATVTGTLPSLILPPTPPSWGSTSRTTPGRVVAKWSNNATARGPYDRVDVQRFDGGRWWNHGRLSATATSYTDTSLPGNDEVRYRVQAVGPGGLSGWTYGGYFATIPAAPSSVSARKSGADIRVSWTDNAGPTNRTRTFLIEDSPDGGAWVQVGSIGGSATSWTHQGPDPARTHRYRVRAQITSGITLTSDYSSASATVQLQAPPGQPGRDAPLDSSTQVVGDQLRFEWTHNPVDTTAQTAAEFQYRIDGGSWSTTTVGANEYLDLTPVVSASRAQLEWRVRTKGDHPDWSPWSTTNGPLLSTAPSVAVQTPAPILDTSRVMVSWSYTPNGTESQLDQSGWQVMLSDWVTGTPLETVTGTTQEEVTLESRLDNDTEYVLAVSVRNGDGLWSSVEIVRFTTNFPLPAPVLCFPSWDQGDASVTVEFQQMLDENVTYQWTGAVGASSSEKLIDGAVVATNHLANSDFEHGETGWYGVGGTMSSITSYTTWMWGGLGGHLAEVASDGGLRPSLNQDVTVSVQQGEWVGISGFIANDPGLPVRIQVAWLNGAGDAWSNSLFVSSPFYEGRREHVAFQAPFDVTQIRVQVQADNPAGNVGKRLWADKLICVTAATEMEALEASKTHWDGATPYYVAVDAIDVERRDEGGEWVLIASGVSTTTAITDRIPRVGSPEYRAISRTILPTETVGPEITAPWPFPVVGAWVCGGPGFGRVCTAAGAAADDKPGIEQTSRMFAGSSRPIAFFGTQRTHTLTFTGTIPLPPNETTVSTRDDWIELLHEFGVVVYRDPTGRKRFGLLDVSFAQSGPLESLSISVEEVQWTEGVPRVTDAELEAMV